MHNLIRKKVHKHKLSSNKTSMLFYYIILLKCMQYALNVKISEFFKNQL